MLGNSATLLQLVLTGLVLCAAGLDMRWRIIPNWLTLAIALIAPLYWIASGLAFWPDMAWQILVGVACFGLFALAFAANMMGGGDVKLIGALGLWFPAIPMARLLVLMALIGGVVGLIYWIGHKLLKRNTALEIPYGVAIAAAALCTLWEPNINPFG